MKKIKKIVFFSLIFLLNINFASAHPGRTDSNGCHYCRTNCVRWGLSDGEYHCHNSGSQSSSSSGSSKSTTPSVRYIYGCTDPSAINYNSNANKDNGSCIKKVSGCTNKDAYNYNSEANFDDGSCIDKVMGCTKETAINYNKDANTSDGSCLFEKTNIKYKKIKYKVKKRGSFFYKKGSVIQKGKKGKKKITKIVVVNEKNEIIEEKSKKVEIIKKPINKIVAK